MSSSMNVILVIGGSGGIGASFTKRFHSMGKQVIVTGRNESRLNELKASLKGLETYAMDNTDLASIPSHVKTLTERYPKIDTVWINGGIQYHFSFADPSSSSDEKVHQEIDSNVTAPMLLARHFIPFLLNKSTATNFMITSSGLAFVPVPQYPIYCPTKAFIHHFLVGLRAQVAGSKMNVIEIAPPRVETDLDAAHKESVSMPAMPLEEYTDKVFEQLDKSKAEDLKEVGVGFSQKGVDAWRGSIGELLKGMGSQG